MKRKLFLLLILASIIAPLALHAGVYGTLRGTVVDQSTGEPVIGATVLIEGYEIGAKTNLNGKYVILKVPAGELLTLKVSSVSYAVYRQEFKVSADQTLTVDVQVSTEEKITEELVVVAPMADPSSQPSTTIVDPGSAEFTSTSVEGINSLVGISSGVINTGAGFAVRGSRSSETQIRVDGLDVGNQFTGAFGLVGRGGYPMVSQYGTEEVQILRGGFTAEYGDAMGGVVNTVVKTGNPRIYEGFARWRHDLDFLYGSQESGVRLFRENEGGRIQAEDYGPGAQLLGPNRHSVDVGFGGPLPILNNSTFFISSVFENSEFGGGYEIFDPAGNNLSRMPNDHFWKKNITGRMKFGLTDDISLMVGGSYGISNTEAMSWGWLYADSYGLNSYDVNEAGQIINPVYNNIPEYIAKVPVANQFVTNYMARIEHQINEKQYYQITISNTSNDDEFAKRVGNESPSYFGGFDLIYPQDDLKVQFDGLVPGKDKIIDHFALISRLGLTKDDYLLIDKGTINDLTGYIEGQSDAQSGDNPYGRVGTFNEHGNTRTFSFRKGNYWQIDGNYNIYVRPEETRKEADESSFEHYVKTGFEFRLYEAHRHNNSLPWDGAPFYDIYTDLWGGNLYAYDNEEVYQPSSEPFRPWRGSLYVQDDITYKGIMMKLGLRMDMFEPNSRYRINFEEFIPISSDTGFADASIKMQVSPRVSIAYPITDKSFFQIAYGLYFKMPELQYLYDAFNKERTRGNDILGEPNMEAQRTNSYQISYNHQIGDLYAFDVTAYYKDIYNQLGLKYVPSIPQPYYQYTVAEYGSAKGLEFGFRKRPDPRAKDPLAFRINYTMASVIGTSSDPGSNYGIPVDPYTNEFAYPLTEFPMPQDIPHSVYASVSFFWYDAQGFSIGGIYLLENSSIGLNGSFRSGSPYTPLDRQGNAIAEVNSARQPSIWSASLRFTKRFFLKDYFGESVGKNTSIEFFVDVYNFLNLNSPIGYYARTNDPLDNGASFDVTEGFFSSVPYYREANFLISETIGSEQYNRFGDRLYSINSDFDSNGMNTRPEKLKAFENQLETSVSFKGNYQTPRTVWFGLMFRF